MKASGTAAKKPAASRNGKPATEATTGPSSSIKAPMGINGFDEKTLLARSTESGEHALSRGRIRMRELRCADFAPEPK